jgi:hypothetical protein
VSGRLKWLLIAVVSLIAVGSTTAMGVFAWARYSSAQSAPAGARSAASADWARGDRIVFRNTAGGQGYGLVASVPLARPHGARVLTDVACDRVDAIASAFVCLRSERGLTPAYDGSQYDDEGRQRLTWPLPGIPSRARFSPDGTLVATTAFESGESYATVRFSTEAEIRRVSDGEVLGSLEDFALIVDGQRIAPADRNFWGITFSSDDDTFYATAATAGRTYLVRGDLKARTLTAIADTAECPSLSPDGTRIAFKRVTDGSAATVHWTPAVLDLASGRVRVLDSEKRSVDDQIAWLDDSTLLYGLPNRTPGDSDVWALAADGSGAPTLFLAHAWSPSVVRTG